MFVGCMLLGLLVLLIEYFLNKGMLGMYGNFGLNMNINKCDVLIVVGMCFDDCVIGNLVMYVKQVKVIYFDIDLVEINKNVYVDVVVLGNCKEMFFVVMVLLQFNEYKEWLDSFLFYEQVEEEKVICLELYLMGDMFLMGEVVCVVSDVINYEVILVIDVG